MSQLPLSGAPAGCPVTSRWRKGFLALHCRRHKKDHLPTKVDTLVSQFAEMKELLLNLPTARPVPLTDSPQDSAPDRHRWDEEDTRQEVPRPTVVTTAITGQLKCNSNVTFSRKVSCKEYVIRPGLYLYILSHVKAVPSNASPTFYSSVSS